MVLMLGPVLLLAVGRAVPPRLAARASLLFAFLILLTHRAELKRNYEIEVALDILHWERNNMLEMHSEGN